MDQLSDTILSYYDNYNIYQNECLYNKLHNLCFLDVVFGQSAINPCWEESLICDQTVGKTETLDQNHSYQFLLEDMRYNILNN